MPARDRGAFSAAAIRRALLLYGVTDRAWLAGRDLVDLVREAVAGGTTFVQLREKDAPREEVVELARRILPVCREAGVPFVIDDYVDVAAEVGADGVHVGQSDTACADARAALGPDAIVGVSAETLDEALAAEAAGADYLGVGAIYATSTKPDAEVLTIPELARICSSVQIPVVAIGGLHPGTIAPLAGTGVAGAAVVSALFAADDPRAAAGQLLAELRPVIG